MKYTCKKFKIDRTTRHLNCTNSCPWNQIREYFIAHTLNLPKVCAVKPVAHCWSYSACFYTPSTFTDAVGVDHGGGRGTSPPEFGVGGRYANCSPLRFLSYRYKKESSVVFKIRQNPFSAGATPWTPLRELTTLHRPVGWRRDTLTIPYPTRHRPTFGARHASPEFQPDLRLRLTPNQRAEDVRQE